MPNAYSVTTCSLYTESDTDVPMCEHSSTLLRACHMLCCSVVCLHGLWCAVLCVCLLQACCVLHPKQHAMVLEEYGGVRRITEDYDCEFEHSSTLLRACHMLCCSVVCLHGLWCGVLCVLATSLLCASYKAHAMVLEKYGGVRRITEDYDCEFEHFSTLLRACHMLCCSVMCRPWPTKPDTTSLPSKPSCGRTRDSETAPTYVKVTRCRLDAPPYTLCPCFGFRARVNK